MNYSSYLDSNLNNKMKRENSPTASPPLGNPRDRENNIMGSDDSDEAGGLPQLGSI